MPVLGFLGLMAMIHNIKLPSAEEHIFYAIAANLSEVAANNLSRPDPSIQIYDLGKLLQIYPHCLWISFDYFVVPPTGIEPVSHA